MIKSERNLGRGPAHGISPVQRRIEEASGFIGLIKVLLGLVKLFSMYA